MTPPPQDTLVSRKLMTGFARDFTGRECTEMSFGMSCIVGSAKGEKSVPQRPPGRLVPIPPATANYRLFFLQFHHDVILGWDFLEASQAVIDCGQNELVLKTSVETYSALEFVCHQLYT
ncbi:hypothetical protein TNCV_589061 [Trichonephila clavipes]|nr:hypothetical protein TNCV_589061 [Trichonephila clavipes]